MVNNKYWLFESVISKEICEKFINQNNWLEKKQATVYKDGSFVVDSVTRSTNVIWQDAQDEILKTILPYFLGANKSAGWNFDITEIEQIQLGEYEVGGHYDWHIDGSAPNNNNIQRKLSMSILLNDENSFDGGKFEFKDMTPKFKQGSVLVFPSFLEHRVTSVTRGTRYSMVAWVSGPAFR